MPKFCPKCGNQSVDDQSSFCTKCGTQLPVNNLEQMTDYCQNCGTQILDKEAVFCVRCGTPLLPKQDSIQQLKPAKICPQCGEPIIDENRYYCKNCGAYIRVDQSTTISSKEKTPATKPLDIKPVISLEVNNNLQTNSVTQQEPTVIKGARKPSNQNASLWGLLIRLVFALVFIWIGINLLGLGNLGFDNFNFGNILQSNKDVYITQDLSSMALTVNDLPSGWIGGGGGGTGNSYSTSFVYPSQFSGGVVTLHITRYTKIENARNEYLSRYANAPTVKLETLNLGNEGFGYIYANDVWVIFRRGNIVVTVEDVRDEYQFYATLNNAKKYAEIVANRIKS